MNAAAKHLDAGLQLGDRRSRDLRAAADAAEFGMDLTMGLPALASVEADETIEQLALFTQRAVEGRRQSRVHDSPLGRRCAFGWRCPGTFARFSDAPMATLPRLPLHQQFMHMLGLEEAG